MTTETRPAPGTLVVIDDPGCLADRETGELVEARGDGDTPFTVLVQRNGVERRYDCANVEVVATPEGWGQDKAPADASNPRERT